MLHLFVVCVSFVLNPFSYTPDTCLKYPSKLGLQKVSFETLRFVKGNPVRLILPILAGTKPSDFNKVVNLEGSKT